MSEISSSSREVVDRLLNGNTSERKEALAALPNLPDKESVSAFLLDRLPEEEDEWRRSWTVSAVAAINAPGAADHVAARLDPGQEEFEWARYWAAIGLAELGPDDLLDHLGEAMSDPHPLVRAIALRLSIEGGVENGYVEELADMAEDPDWYTRWAACKVLRREAGRVASFVRGSRVGCSRFWSIACTTIAS